MFFLQDFTGLEMSLASKISATVNIYSCRYTLMHEVILPAALLKEMSCLGQVITTKPLPASKYEAARCACSSDNNYWRSYVPFMQQFNPKL